MSEVYAACARHRDALASFRCEGCRAHLCVDCVDEGRLVICRLCGERAHPLVDEPGAGVDAVPVGDGAVLYHGRDGASAEGEDGPERWRDDPVTLLIHHGVVPAATIAMITALLFYLVDVRSVFLAGSGSLKWLGTCFVTATVLIARYGKMDGAGERQGCYTFALLAATLMALVVAPWEKTTPGPVNLLVNGLIVIAIWRFASAITRGSSLEGLDAVRRGRRLYGLERLAFEQAGATPPGGRGGRGRGGESAGDEGADGEEERPRPGRSVARLAALGLVVFALLEPALLSGTTEVVRRALGAMVVFLLAAGVVLAASSSVETLRRVRQRRGRVKTTHLSGRVVVAALAMVVLVALMLTLPGIETRGRGERTGSRATPGLWDMAGDRGPQGHQTKSPDGGQLAEASERPGPRPGEARDAGSPAGEQVVAAGEGLLGILGALGRWLRWPAILLAGVVMIVAVVRLWPLLAAWRQGLGEGWRGWWQRWMTRLRRLPGARGSGGTLLEDPWAGLGALGGQPPRQAVVEAYRRFLLALAVAGFERQERLAPYELVSAVARWRRALEPAAHRLTDLYVAAAFGAGEVPMTDREQALRSLDALRRALPVSP